MRRGNFFHRQMMFHDRQQRDQITKSKEWKKELIEKRKQYALIQHDYMPSIKKKKNLKNKKYFSYNQNRLKKIQDYAIGIKKKALELLYDQQLKNVFRKRGRQSKKS